MKAWLIVSAVIVLLCGVAGLLAPYVPFCDYFNHFRPQAMAIGGLLLPIALLMRSRGVVALALLIIVLNAGVMEWGYMRSLPPQEQKEPESYVHFTVLSANVLRSNDITEVLLEQVRQNNPDCLVVVELSPVWAEALKSLDTTYPHHVSLPRDDAFGVAIYSKWPFAQQIYEVGQHKTPLVQADFPAFTLLAVHPTSPMGMVHLREHQAYLQAIGQTVQAIKKPVVVAGDFNTTLWSMTVPPLYAAGLYHIGGAFHYTWPNFFPLGGIQIDHVFASGGIKGTLTVLQENGSDHFPIKAELQIPTQR
jgi:vancomycin resistance protein VanJ